MLPIESVLDELVIWVELVDNPVRIVLHTCSEDHDLIVLRHLLEELEAIRPDQEE